MPSKSLLSLQALRFNKSAGFFDTTKEVLVGDGKDSLNTSETFDENGFRVRGGFEQMNAGIGHFAANALDKKDFFTREQGAHAMDAIQGASRSIGGLIRDFTYQPFIDAKKDHGRYTESYNRYGLLHPETIDRAGSVIGNGALGTLFTFSGGALGLGGKVTKLIGKPVLNLASKAPGAQKLIGGASALKQWGLSKVLPSLPAKTPEMASTIGKGVAIQAPFLGAIHADQSIEAAGAKRDQKIQDAKDLKDYKESAPDRRYAAPNGLKSIKDRMADKAISKANIDNAFKENSIQDSARSFSSQPESKADFFNRVQTNSVNKLNNPDKFNFGQFMSDYKYPIMGVGAGLGAIGLLSAYRNREAEKNKKKRYARLVPQRPGLV